MTVELLTGPQVEERLRTACHAVIPTLADDVEDDQDLADYLTPLLTRTATLTPRGPRRAVTLAAVAASVVALAGVAVTWHYQKQPATVPSSDSTTLTIPSTTAEASQPAPTSADVQARVATGWYLPVYTPPGYEMINLTATLDDPSDGEPASKWLRRSADGSKVEATFTITTYGDSTESIPPGTDTVHSQPAEVWDPGTGFNIRWTESHVYIVLSSTGLGKAELLAAAELVVVNDAAGTASLPTPPAGFAPTDAAPPDPDAVHLQIDLSPTDYTATGFISLSVGPNNQGETLDSLLHRLPGRQKMTFGGIDRAILAEAPDSLGPFTSITWVEGGSVFWVSGRAPYDEMVAFAERLAPATVDAVKAAGESITTRTLAMDKLDEITLNDHTHVVAIRQGNEFTGLCVTEPIQRCHRLPSTVALGGEPRAGDAATFEINGSRVVIAWHAGDEQPTLVAANGPTLGTATASTFTQVATTATGVFAQVVLDDGMYAPEIRFGQTGYFGALRFGTIVFDY